MSGNRSEGGTPNTRVEVDVFVPMQARTEMSSIKISRAVVVGIAAEMFRSNLLTGQSGDDSVVVSTGAGDA